MQPSQPSPKLSPDSADRLESWKEIAEYLGKGVTTVRRWEREEGLPVRRQEHLKRGSIVAYKQEIDAWLGTRVTPLPESEVVLENEPLTGSKRRTGLGLWGASAVAVLLTGVAGWGLMHEAPVRATEPKNTLVTSGSGVNEFPDLSPDGRRVVYSRRGSSGAGLFVREVGSSSEAVRLTSTKGEDLVPRWSPDGQWILFHRSEGDSLDLMKVAPQGGEPVTVLRRPRPVLGMPVEWAAWMPDGRTVILADRKGPGDPLALFRLTLATGARQQLTFPASGYGDVASAASPDGETVAFIRFQGGGEADVYTVPARGGPERRLTSDACVHAGLAWDTDGQHLIYSAVRSGHEHSLWRIHRSGGSPEVVAATLASGARQPSLRQHNGNRRVTYTQFRQSSNVLRWDVGREQPHALAPSAYVDNAAHYSPDGRSVVFCSHRTGPRELWIVASDGGEARQITRLGRYSDSPRWSPDGKQIVFSSVESDNRDVYVVGSDGAGLRRITTEASDDGRPSWSPDGRWIYFRSNRSGSRQIWRAPAAGGQAVQITRRGGFEPLAESSGKWLYYTMDRDQPGLWRVPVAGGAEEKVLDRVRESHWALAQDGIYFVRQEPRAQLWRWPFGAAEPALLHADLGNRGSLWAGFSVRRDGKSWLVTKGQTRSEIVVLDEAPARR